MAHLILYTDANFRGVHKHVFDRTDALSFVVTDSNGNAKCLGDCDFPIGVSSIAILSGNWQFFQNENLIAPFPVVLGPGLYRFVNRFKLLNDQIRSMQPVSDAPTIPGEPLNGYATLFEHANFRGAHLHVFEGQSDLSGVGFDKRTSSIVVEAANWSFFFDTQFDGSYPGAPVLGPGIYPWVEDIGIKNDSIRSLQPSTSKATTSNAVDNHVILFLHEGLYGGLHGEHRHVFGAEPKLDEFNDSVRSLTVLAGTWSFYSDPNFFGLYGLYGRAVGPGNYGDLTTLDILSGDMSSLRPFVPVTVTLGLNLLGHVILFKNANFQGPHKHVFNEEDNLNKREDNSFNDAVSSLVVLSGNWKFYRNYRFGDDYPAVLGPGLYPSVEDVGIRNDDMSSLQVVDQAPTLTGDPVTSHIVLFEHAYFHGAHKHLFGQDNNLGADNFDNITSSIVVHAGTWLTFSDPNTETQFPAQLGPGLYPILDDVGIANDSLSSLAPTEMAPTVNGQVMLGQAMLFEHANYRGAHKHVFNEEPDLNAGDDNSFNDKTSSLVVLQNRPSSPPPRWFTFRDKEYHRQYDVTLGEGLFPGVEQVGIANDAMSSLEVAGDRLNFHGSVTVNIKSGSFPDPITNEIEMTFLFQSDTTVLTLERPFKPIAINAIGLHERLYLDRTGVGHLVADGTVTIPDVKIRITLIGLNSEANILELTFLLSTGTAESPNHDFMDTGSLRDGSTGHVKLVGAGRKNDDDFLVVLDGTLLPEMP